jgi:hypothetical protein
MTTWGQSNKNFQLRDKMWLLVINDWIQVVKSLVKNKSLWWKRVWILIEKPNFTYYLYELWINMTYFPHNQKVEKNIKVTSLTREGFSVYIGI